MQSSNNGNKKKLVLNCWRHGHWPPAWFRISIMGLLLLVIGSTASPAFALSIVWQTEAAVSDVDGYMSSLSWSSQRSVAVSANGRIHVVWTDMKPPPYPEMYMGVWYSYSDNGGNTWSASQCISQPVYYGPQLLNYTNESPSVAVINPEQINAMWDAVDEAYYEGFAFYDRSDDNGISWQHRAQWQYWAVEPPSGFNSLCSDGNNYLMFYDQQWVPQFMEYRLLNLYSTNSGENWQSASWHGWDNGNKSDEIPCTACDSNDAGYLVWDTVDTLNHPVIMYGTTGGVEKQLVPYAGTGGRGGAFIESDLNGKLYVVWSDSRDGNNEIYFKKSTDRGVTWGSDMRVTSASGSSESPVIVLGGQGRIFLVWVDNRDGNKEIYFKCSENDGATWNPDTRLTYNISPSDYPHIAVSPSKDAIYVAWNDDRDGQSEAYFKRGDIVIGVSESQHETEAAEQNVLKTDCSIFRDRVVIRISNGNPGNAQIYDLKGMKIKAYDIAQSTGQRSAVISWDGTDHSGHKVPAGIYFVRFESKDCLITKKLILLR
jgi:hypothetical protein